MHYSVMSCPPVGHKAFEKSLSQITIGDVDCPEQITKFVRPTSCTLDDLGMIFQPGELQKADLILAQTLFAYPQFVSTTFKNNLALFRNSEFRIYQFQAITPTGATFIFGLFITDGAHNLLDFCVDSPQTSKRRTVLIKLIRAICTPRSVAFKFSH